MGNVTAVVNQVNRDATISRLNSKLHEMKGKVYLFKGIHYKINFWTIDGDYCHIGTNKKMIVEPIAGLVKVLKEDFLPSDESLMVQEVEEAQLAKIVTPNLKTLKNYDDVIGKLLSGLDRVDKDKDYAAQFEALTKGVHVFSEMTKWEIDAWRMANDLKSKL